AMYFENVSRCLSDIATALKEGTEPRQACEELETYALVADRMPREKEDLILRVYGKDLAIDLGFRLSDLTSVRKDAVGVLLQFRRGNYMPSYNDTTPQEVLAESIVKIEKAAGNFKA